MPLESHEPSKIQTPTRVGWAKGQSGNPNGRPVGARNKNTAECKELAGKYGPEAIKKLARLMRGKDRRTDNLIKQLTEANLDTKAGQTLAKQLLQALSERKPENELGAAKELLDRAYGKASQPLVGADGGPAKIVIERRIVDPRVVEGEVIEHEPGPAHEQGDG